jgi:hypothetical protein
MVKRLVLVPAAVAAAVTAGTALAGPSGSDRGVACVENTQLRPENEFRPPGSPDPVESTAQGHAQLTVRNDGTIGWKVVIRNRARETFVAGHIHLGAPGSNGGVVQGLFGGPPASDRQFHDRGEVALASQQTPGLAEQICESPGAYYVNYHTTQDPGGAVRGQLG